MMAMIIPATMLSRSCVSVSMAVKYTPQARQVEDTSGLSNFSCTVVCRDVAAFSTAFFITSAQNNRHCLHLLFHIHWDHCIIAISELPEAVQCWHFNQLFLISFFFFRSIYHYLELSTCINPFHGRSKGKFSHIRYRMLGPELIHVYRQSAHRWLIKSFPGDRLPLLFTRPAITFPADEHHWHDVVAASRASNQSCSGVLHKLQLFAINNAKSRQHNSNSLYILILVFTVFFAHIVYVAGISC